MVRFSSLGFEPFFLENTQGKASISDNLTSNWNLKYPMEVGLIVLLAVVGALPHPKAGSAGAGYWSQKIRLPTWEPTYNMSM